MDLPLDLPLPAADTAHPLTRVTALARLERFPPLAGAAYAARRNHDHGPGKHDSVSRLSAALRRRVVSEAEVALAAVQRHGADGAEKFVSEVFWRTYWKGWLEQRPAVWRDYLRETEAQHRALDANAGLRTAYAQAIAGRTGIDCFDHWVGELRTTGFLHNWSRMQFASIWIFTLRLPWALGADFTLRHFIDADPASNTLSWRWVAGLHTAGKAYLASADRIAKMTGGRFAPRGLAEVADIPDAPPPPPATAPRAYDAPDTGGPAVLLLTPEDLSLELEPDVARLPIRAVAVAPADGPDALALADAAERAVRAWGLAPAVTLDPERAAAQLADIARGCSQIVTGFAPVGPTADWLAALRPGLAARGLRLAEHRRGWDERAWPHCRRGFFQLRERIPALLAAAGG